MNRNKILIIEDDDDISELVRFNLEKDGFKVIGVSTGEAGLKRVRTDRPDLVILDLMLPGMDGLTVCRELRTSPATRDIPVVMLTARGEDIDVVAGLEVGADDYITKPFSPRVLTARVRALLRRRSAREETTDTKLIRRGDIEIDVARHEVKVGGKAIDLTTTEFKLLQFLAEHPGAVFSRYQLVDAVHGSDYPVTDRSVDVQIVGLRKKMKTGGDSVETVRGVGYRFKDSNR